MDDLTSILLGEEFEANIFQAMNGGVNTTLHTGGGDEFFPSNYPAGQFSPNHNYSSSAKTLGVKKMLGPNTTKRPNAGLVDRAAQLDGVAQSQSPEENIQDVPLEKKRRKTMEQVQRFEERFNEKNKLGPNQKDELAEELGLDPKQVVDWFQNRRSRSKGKILEAEYYTLKDHYDLLKADYDRLFMDTQLLKNEASMLSNEIKLIKEEKANLGSMNGFMNSVEGNKLSVEPQLPPRAEDQFKGQKHPSMEFVFWFGQSEGDLFDSALAEDFDFLLSGMDDVLN